MNQDPKQNRPGHGNQNEPDHSKRTKSILIMVVVALAFTIIINLVYTSIANSYLKQITFTEFQTLLDEGKVDSVDIDTDRFLILTKEEAEKPEAKQIIYYTGRPTSMDLWPLMEEMTEKGIKTDVPLWRR